MSVSDPKPCTAVIVDIRDFTARYRACCESGDELRFLQFLEGFYRECVRCCEATGASAAEGSLYLNSTGDGVLAVFLDPKHNAWQAFAAGLLLCSRLPQHFSSYGYLSRGMPLDSFGIGVESGTVRLVRSTDTPSGFATCIGDAINLSSRLEKQTKSLARTPMLVGMRAYAQLAERLEPGFDYMAKSRAALAATGANVERQLDEMVAMNRRLSLKYVNHLYLDGVKEAVAVFRYSPSLASENGNVLVLAEKLFGSRTLTRFRELHAEGYSSDSSSTETPPPEQP